MCTFGTILIQASDETYTSERFLIYLKELIIQIQKISKLNDRKELFFTDWLKDNNKIQKKLFRFVDLEKWKSNNIVCNTIHKKHKYKSMNKNNIYKKVCKLIDKYLD